MEKILHSVGRQFFFFGRLFIEKKIVKVCHYLPKLPFMIVSIQKYVSLLVSTGIPGTYISKKPQIKFRSFQEYASGVRHTDLTHDGSLMEVNTIIKSVSNIITSACNILITCLLIQDALSSFLFSFLVLSVMCQRLRSVSKNNTARAIFILFFIRRSMFCWQLY